MVRAPSIGLLGLVFVVALLAATPAGAQDDLGWRWNADSNQPMREAGRIVDFALRVEARLEIDEGEAAAIVAEILDDERSWTGLEDVVFHLSEDPEAEFLVTIASPATTDQMCLPLNTVGRLSCRRGNQIILNADRWNRGPDVYHTSYDGALDEYRRYLVNHEVGHFLGKGHVQPANCSESTRAPVMMQQTFGLRGCAINGWPSLDGTELPPAELAPSIAHALRRRGLTTMAGRPIGGLDTGLLASAVLAWPESS